MTVRVPRKLRKAPLVDVIFELRFEPTEISAGDLLPGLLFSALRTEYPNVSPLPLASVPREVREQNEELRFQPSHRLAGSSRVVQVGERSVTLGQSPPYEGWERFAPRVTQLIDALEATGLVANISRFSVRCLNIVSGDPDRQLAQIDSSLSLAGRQVSERGFRLRTEFARRGFINIVQLTTNTNAKIPSGELITGLLVDVDTIREVSTEEFRANRQQLLSEIHAEVKQTFFELLRPTTLEVFEPEWGDH